MGIPKALTNSIISLGIVCCFSLSFAAENSIQSPRFLVNIHQTVNEDKKFNHAYTKSGCFVRAHWIAELVKKEGHVPFKIFIQTSTPQEKMQIQLLSGVKTHWVFHVAAAYEDSNFLIWVIDPILFDKPVLVSDWLNLIHKQNPSLSLKIEKKGAETYHLEPLENAEFSRLGDPFSSQAMSFIQDAMEDLFIWQASEEANND